MDIYQEIYEQMIMKSDDIKELGLPNLKMNHPEEFIVGNKKLTPKDLLHLRDKINEHIEALSYYQWHLLYYGISLNGDESVFLQNNPRKYEPEEENNSTTYEVHGSFAFLFENAVTETGMANNHEVAKQIKQEWLKKYPNTTIDFDAEASCCYFSSTNKEEMEEFVDWFQEEYLNIFCDGILYELKIKGFNRYKENKVEFVPKNS